MATTNKVTGLEKFTEKQLKKVWLEMVDAFNSNQNTVKRSYKSSLGGDFSRYPVKFDTKKITKQVTRSYGSQRYGRTLVKATHEMDDKTKNIKRKLRSITNNG
ncbi:hypothetical protein KMD03_gp30 [Lactococcus phage CHPC1183]|uniref:Uncharacterized protein n=1 Tax=Lactococcus phage CHPC1183 TaxID=2675243 RepID=A0A650ERQ6_9CAUD|nr:hypothetical protein KMD03_gp30 [Lactococcus phage CHPC1183]QGT52680.1 hypothetical protein CHPC1183_000334 [Lactococcus phage CHPC1183]